MAPLQIVTVGLGGTFALLSGLLGVICTCAMSNEGCGTTGAGVGFAVAIILAVLAVISTAYISGKTGSRIKELSEMFIHLSEFSEDLYEDYEPIPNKCSGLTELTELEDSYNKLNEVLRELFAFIPHQVFKSKDHDKEAAMATMKPSDLQSVGTLGKASTIRSSSTQMSASKYLSLHSQFTYKRISVLAVNIRAFRYMFSDAAVMDDVLMLLNEYSHEIELIVKDHRGIIDTFHGDHVVLTFNAFSSCSVHTRKAVACATAICAKFEELSQDPHSACHDIEVGCGISTGNAFVGNAGSVYTKRPHTIGTVFTQAITLQRLCKLYFPASKKYQKQAQQNGFSSSPGASPGASTSMSPNGSSIMSQPISGPLPSASEFFEHAPREQILIQHHVAADVEHEYVVQAIDVLCLPGISKRSLIYALYSPGSLFENFKKKCEETSGGAPSASPGGGSRRKTVSHTAHTEWMYQMQDNQDDNPFFGINSAFQELYDGDLQSAKEHLTAHKKMLEEDAEGEEEKRCFSQGLRMLSQLSEGTLETAIDEMKDKPSDEFFVRNLGSYYEYCTK